MYIIDGKEVSKEEIEKLNSDDIATIEVLKGGSADDKYGKKGENGVVVVKTKN